MIALAARLNEADRRERAADLAALPALLRAGRRPDRGRVLDGEQLNAADLQIAASCAWR